LVNIDYNIFLVFIFTIKSIAHDEVKTSLNKNECKNHMSAKREYRLSYSSALMYIYFLIVNTEERVVGHQHERLLLKLFLQSCGHILFVYHQAEHIFVKPAVSHNDAATLTMTGAPAVFYLPLQGVALGVEVDSAERHGVCRATVKGVDTLGL
jgi:hypothetical protein